MVIGQGYGILARKLRSDKVSRSLRHTIDPTYTGKAMAGFLSGLQNRQFNGCKRIIFLHTGGEPAFFAGNGDWLNTDHLAV
jgi:1-aminocyclopropane-1-carboxylate deaminase/D-cysteine desulfhydrase-like pyridoxal-dependent ACC family enzyme